MYYFIVYFGVTSALGGMDRVSESRPSRQSEAKPCSLGPKKPRSAHQSKEHLSGREEGSSAAHLGAFSE